MSNSVWKVGVEYILHSIRNTFNFYGRATPLEYRIFVIFGWILSAVFLEVIFANFDVIVMEIPGWIPKNNAQFAGFLIKLYLFWVIVVGHSITIRRLHDIDYSGIWCIGLNAAVVSLFYFVGSGYNVQGLLMLLSFFLPMVYGAIIIALMAIKSSKGENRFGKPQVYK